MVVMAISENRTITISLQEIDQF